MNFSGKTVYIHIGASKTGSTSIQKTLSNMCRFNRLPDDFVYLKSDINASNGLAWAIGEVASCPGAKLVKRNNALSILKSFDEKLKKNTHKNVIISSEGFSKLGSKGQKFLKFFFRKYFEKVVIIGYVRNFHEYMASSYQQILKNPSSDQVFSGKFLRNRVRNLYDNLSSYVDLFGNENVIYQFFPGVENLSWDVVANFFFQLQIPYFEQERLYENAGLSLPAVKALYSLNRYSFESKISRKPYFREFIDWLRTFEGVKFSFDSNLSWKLIGGKSGFTKRSRDFFSEQIFQSPASSGIKEFSTLNVIDREVVKRIGSIFSDVRIKNTTEQSQYIKKILNSSHCSI